MRLGTFCHTRWSRVARHSIHISPIPIGYRDRLSQWKAMGTVTLLASTTVVGITIGAVVYFLLLITLGIISLRKGHWVMFIIGLFFPLFWFIGALLPRKNR
jgi:hypothetical protein